MSNRTAHFGDSKPSTAAGGPTADIRFLYLVSEGFPPTVFDSQVMEHIRQMAPLGIQFDLIVFERLLALRANWKQNQQRLRDLRPRLPGKLHFGVLATTFLGWDFWVPEMQLNSILKRYREPRLVIHARTQTSAAIALQSRRRFPNLKVIFDMRGDSAAEYLLTVEKVGGNPDASHVRKKFARLKAIEKKAVEEADGIICVSEVMRQQVLEGYRVKPDKLWVIPTVASTERFRWDPDLRQKTRKEFSLDGKFVLIYTGSLRAYQMLSGLVEALRQWTRYIQNLHFLLITPQVAEAQASLPSQLPVGSYTVASARHDEMVLWLNAADAGLLLRESNAVNRVAAPTKFPEYQMCGLPAILTENIGDYSRFAQEQLTGIVLKGNDLAAEGLRQWTKLVALTEAYSRARIARLAADRFSHQKFARVFRELYLSV